MKSIFAARSQAFALVSTLGMLASYGIAHDLMKDLVVPEDLPTLLCITYLAAVACVVPKKKKNFQSDLITSFAVYNLATLLYLTWQTATGPTHEYLIADLIKCMIFMFFGYPVVLVTLLPALIFSISILAIYRKYTSRKV